MKTLAIVSHPYPKNSTSVKHIAHALEAMPDVTVRNLETLYGDDTTAFDVEAEQTAANNADRIIFLFPVHWFNLTPMLKAYLNAVWTYGWAFGPEGEALKGKEMLVVTTAGATAHTYSAEGIIQSSMEAVLTPMKASALYVGMKYAEPLALYEALGASESTLTSFSTQLKQRLSA